MVIIAVVVSLLSGVTIVLSRTLNARLTAATSVMGSTLYNYVVGLCCAVLIMLVMGQRIHMPQSGVPPAWVFLGGVMGVCMVAGLNVVTPKISAFYLTLFLFVGQVFAGVAVDILLTGVFSLPNLLGGTLVAAGLCFNLWADVTPKKKQT